MYAHPNVNDACIMLGVHTFGLEADRVPCVARCILAGDERAPSHRRTVPRGAIETPDAFWARVVNTVRELKAGRAYNHTVSVFFDYTNSRTAADWFMDDAKFNLHQIDIHTAYHSRSGKRRVDALCKLYDSAMH